ncbi:MAG: asparagine synthase (glutamine-hydrolyzing) [Methylomicrobium sp.]
MCGITGFFSNTPQPAHIARHMTDLIRHRGPDDEGYALFADLASEPLLCGGDDTPAETYRCASAFRLQQTIDQLGDRPVRLALGHRRLAIVDLSPLGHQPMCSADGRYWMVYNGEVYNHWELRSELETLGYRFVSHSDTEVILAAYHAWGKTCLQRFNGMFALLIYDRQQHTLFAARDRFGVKPLYYRLTPSSLAFASEIKQFTALPDWKPHMNGQRVYDFLAWGLSDHTDETLFAGVFQLRGGQAVEVDLAQVFANNATEKLPVYHWYQLTPQPFSGSFSEAAGQFKEKLVDSVQLRLRADVPVGSCLSGGLDSSSIVCIANRLLREQHAHALQKTFSACAYVAKFDERYWIDIVEAATGVDAHHVYPDLGQLFNEAPKITWHQDEPFGSTSIYAQWRVFGLAASQQVKVMLDGQGADEQLAGYHGFFGPHLAGLFKSLHWFELLRELSAINRLHGYGYCDAARHIANYTLPETLKQPLRKISGRTTTHPAWLNVQRLGCRSLNPLLSIGAAGAGSVTEMSVAQLTASNLQMLLHWEDRDSMAHSIEARVPFLDYRLVEFVLGLPDDYKLAGGVTKRVLREGMTGILPDPIRNRMDKLGFVTPEEVWLRQTAPDLFKRQLKEAIDMADGVLHSENTNQCLEDIISGKQAFSFLPWRLINFGEWIKQFSVKVAA